MSCATLRDLRARREAQLVARDVRAGDGADHLRLDAEVPERLDQARRGLLLAGGVRARLLAGRARQQLLASGSSQTKLGVVGDRVAQPALRRQLGGVGARDARDSGVLARSLERSSSARRAIAPARVRARWLAGSASTGVVALGRVGLVRVAPAPAPRRASRARPARRRRARAARSSAARGARVDVEVLGAPPASSPLGVPRRSPSARTIRVVSATPLPVARSAPPSDAPVSSDHADEQQEDDEDVHADVLHEPVGELVERLADDAAVGLQVRRASTPRRRAPRRS